MNIFVVVLVVSDVFFLAWAALMHGAKPAVQLKKNKTNCQPFANSIAADK